VSLTFDL